MAYINYRCMKAVGLVKVCGIRRRNDIVVVKFITFLRYSAC